MEGLQNKLGSGVLHFFGQILKYNSKKNQQVVTISQAQISEMSLWHDSYCAETEGTDAQYDYFADVVSQANYARDGIPVEIGTCRVALTVVYITH